jgi:hypothetical protein
MRQKVSIRMRVREIGEWLELAKSMERLNASDLKVNTKSRCDGTIALTFYAAFEERDFYEAILDVVAFLEKQQPQSFDIAMRSGECGNRKCDLAEDVPRDEHITATAEDRPFQRNGQKEAEPVSHV